MDTLSLTEDELAGCTDIIQHVCDKNKSGYIKVINSKMVEKYLKGKVAVFVDASNIYFSQKTLGWQVDFRRLHDYFKNKNNLFRISFYGALNPENIKERKFHDFLEIIGYVVRRKKIKFIYDKEDKEKGGHHKGNVDVDLTIDAVDLRDNYDSFVLLSGDGDFESLLKYLKKHGKRCLVISTKGHVSFELIRQAKFIDFKKLKEFVIFKNQNSPSDRGKPGTDLP